MTAGALVNVIDGVIQFYAMLIFAYVLISWARPTGFLFDVYRVIGSVVEPYVGLFRRLVPPAGLVDFSPMVAILVLQFLIRPVLLTLAVRA